MVKIRRKKTAKGHPLAYLLDWYMLLRSGVPAGFGHQPASWQDIQALDRVFDLELDAFDTETLRRLDVIWLKCRPTKDQKGGET